MAKDTSLNIPSTSILEHQYEQMLPQTPYNERNTFNSNSNNNNVSFQSIIKSLIKSLIMFCIVCLILTFVISPIICYRQILKLIALVVRSDFTHMLYSQSHWHLEGSSVAESVFSNTIIRVQVEGKLRFEEVKALIRNNLVEATCSEKSKKLLYPELQQYCVKWGGYFFWKPESHFNVDEHVEEFKGRNNSINQPCTANQLNEIEINFLKEGFELDKSPWKILFVETLQPPDLQNGRELTVPHYAMLFKFHHSVGDGFAMFKALMKITDDELVPSLLDRPRPETSNYKRFIYFITFPFLVAIHLSKYTSGAMMVSKPSGWDQPYDQSPKKATKQIVANPSSRLSCIQVERVKKIVKEKCVSFTAVLAALVAGGVRRHLLAKSNEEVPEYMRCSLPIPYGYRSGKLINSISSLILNLPVGVSSLPVRLKLCHDAILDTTNSFQPALSYFILNEIPPSLIIKTLGMNDVLPLLISNFAGPLAPVWLDGNKVCDMSYAVLSPPICLSVTILSYAGHLRITCSGDGRIFSSLGQVAELASFIEEEIDELEHME